MLEKKEKKSTIQTSVIIPVYNTGMYVEECIESVYRQTTKEIEVIAINDGSTDNSYDILLTIQKRHPDLIVLSQDNHGLGYTRNVGMKKAKGKYIYFLDSDDYILEDTLETCYRYAEDYQLDVVLFDAVAFWETKEGRIEECGAYDRHEIDKGQKVMCSGIDFMEACYHKKIFQPSACLVFCSYDFLKKNNVQFLSDVYFEDNEFHCHIMMLAERIMYIPDKFYQRRCLSTSITGTEFNLRKVRDYLTVINAITDLRKLNYGKKWRCIRKVNLNLLNNLVHVCYSNHLYHKDIRLILRILMAWVRMVR